MKNTKYYILPLLMIFMQGLYTNIQCSIAIILFMVIIKKVCVSVKQLIGVSLVIIGFVVSDLTTKNDGQFIYEMLKVTLLLMGISFSNLKNKNSLLLGCYTAISIVSAIGIFSYLFKLEGYGIINSIGGTKVLQGFFGYANTNALFCGIGIILSLNYISQKNNFQFIHEMLLIINVIALLLTRSLFGCACLMFSVALIAYIKFNTCRKYLIGISVFVIVAIVGIFISGNEEIIIRSTVASRLIYWYDALLLLLKQPFGIGVHNWENIQPLIQTADYSVKYIHNSFIQLALDGGIISLGGFVFLLSYGYVCLIKKYNQNDKFCLYLIAILTFIILHSFVDINFAYGVVWFSIGLVLSHSMNDKRIESKIVMPIIILVFTVLVIFIPEKRYINPFPISYQEAYKANDLNKMNEISAKWIDYTPRQQDAYDARYYVLDKMNDAEGLMQLQIKKDEINNSMNPLCKYLTRHRNIILPEVNE